MNLAISNIAWSPNENDLIFSILREKGVKGVEIAPTLFWPNPTLASRPEIEDIKTYFSKAGFTIPAAQALLFNQPELTLFQDEDIREQTLEYIKKLSNVCAILGVSRLVFGSPKNRQKGKLTQDQAMDIASDFFLNLACYISPMGMILCLEPNPAEYGCDFILNTSEAVDLIQRVNHPNFQLHLDTSSVFLNKEVPESLLPGCIPFARHCHVSEPFLGLIGEHQNDHAAIAKCLHASNYSEWISIEMKSGLRLPNSIAIVQALNFTSEVYLKN